MKSPFLALILALALATHAQKTQLEINLGNLKLGQVSGVNVGDSAFLFLNVTAEKGASVINRSFWLLPNGKNYSADLPELASKTFLNVVAKKDTAYYYFVEEQKKGASIKTLINVKSWLRVLANQEIPLESKVYGSFVENDSFYLIASGKSPYILKLVQIRGTTVVKETIFNLGINLQKYEKAGISFSSEAPFTPSKAITPLKIRKDGDAIFVYLDETVSEDPTVREPPKENRTVVHRLDIKTGKTSTNVFVHQPEVYFNSAIFNDRLYRLSRWGGYWVDVFDLTSGKNIYTKQLGRYTTFYTQPFIIADTTASGSLVLTMGSEGKRNTGVPTLQNFGLVGVLASAITRIAISNLDERLVFYEYNYLEGSVEDEFYERNYVDRLLTKTVADYESQNTPITYKGYINGPGLIYGIYRYKDSSTLRIVKFE